MRVLKQPGPLGFPRVEMARGALTEVSFPLRTGVSLHEAVTGPLVEAGFQGGTVEIRGGALDPFRYVMPGPPDGPGHVAYFTAPVAPVGVSWLERANLTFGWHEGGPFLHCHAVWVEPDGRRRGGHILPRESVVVGPGAVSAWGFRDVRVETGFDAETGFTLFGVSGGGGPGAVAARVRPNVDICEAVETVALECGWSEAVVRGSLGSLVGAEFEDGRVVGDYATEVLVLGGHVVGRRAALDLAVVDMRGEVHEGRLVRGGNGVLITFDLVMNQGG